MPKSKKRRKQRKDPNPRYLNGMMGAISPGNILRNASLTAGLFGRCSRCQRPTATDVDYCERLGCGPPRTGAGCPNG